MSGKKSIFDNVAMLALVGILAGALGGLAIGIVTGRAQSSTFSSSTNR
jgi:NhaP-type Na+/H+ or K+/H+ antiporter